MPTGAPPSSGRRARRPSGRALCPSQHTMLHYTPCQPRGEHCSQCELHTEQRSGTARSPVSSVRRLPSGLASHLCPLRSRNSSGPSRRRLSLSPCPARAPLLGGGAGAVGGARAVNGALGRRRGTSSRNFLCLGQVLGGLELPGHRALFFGRKAAVPQANPGHDLSRRSHLLSTPSCYGSDARSVAG